MSTPTKKHLCFASKKKLFTLKKFGERIKISIVWSWKMDVYNKFFRIILLLHFKINMTPKIRNLSIKLQFNEGMYVMYNGCDTITITV
jgi:hypothetical protein